MYSLPSLNGNGDVNPTQNFVDAFPMADGYPYGDPNSQYAVDPENPYAEPGIPSGPQR